MAISTEEDAGAAGFQLWAALLEATDEILDSAEPWGSVRSFLGRVAVLLGASRVVLIETAGGQQRLFEVEPSRSAAEGLDLEIWRGLGEGEIRRVTADRLSRSARFLRAGARRLTVCTAPTRGASARTLWVESAAELEATSALLRLAAASSGQLLSLAERVQVDTADAALKRRGTAALAMVHDLRHQLALGSLCAHRAREGNAAEAASSLAELDLALSKAREISQDALGDPRGETDRDTAIQLRDVLQEEAKTVGQIGGVGGRIAIALRCGRTLRVRGKESTLSRLIRNLLLNAYKASNAKDRVLISAEKQGQRIVVRIEDSGRGMDERRVRQLFTSDATASGGAGCGTLSILAGVEELNAELEVESTVGSGTRVSLNLHAFQEGDQAADELAVLLVDGNQARRVRRAHQLETLGERVLHISRVEEALFELERVQPKRILVERGLPGEQLDRLTQRARELDIEVRALEYRDACDRL